MSQQRQLQAAEKMMSLVHSLVCRHEDLNSIPPEQTQGRVWHHFHAILPLGFRGRRAPGTYWLPILAKAKSLGSSHRLSENKAESHSGREQCRWPDFTCTNTCRHVHTYEHIHNRQIPRTWERFLFFILYLMIQEHSWEFLARVSHRVRPQASWVSVGRLKMLLSSSSKV